MENCNMEREMNCSNCKYLTQVNKHPMNVKIGRGSITEKLGYVCHAPEIDNPMFFEHDKGMCEMFQRKGTIKATLVSFKRLKPTM